MNEAIEFLEAFFAKEFQKGTGLAARDDEAVDFVELLGFADQDDLRPKLFEAAAVGVEIALQS